MRRAAGGGRRRQHLCFRYAEAGRRSSCGASVARVSGESSSARSASGGADPGLANSPGWGGKAGPGSVDQQCEAVLRQFSPDSAAAEMLPQKQLDVIRSIWQRLLHRMKVDPDEDFYASGGTSVQRIRLYAELNQRFPGAFHHDGAALFEDHAQSGRSPEQR